MSVADYTSDLTGFLVFIVTFLFLFISSRRPSGVPPGPYLLPVIGNILSLAGDPIRALNRLRSKYGDVVGLYIGSELTVFVNGYDAIHEITVKRGLQFSHRPKTAFFKSNVKYTSIVFENGQRWKDNRTFTQNVFQKLCFNKGRLGIEEKINEELSFFVEKLKTFTEPIDIAGDIQLSLSSVVFNILHGKRPGYTDQGLLWYLNTLTIEFKVFRRNQLITDCFPFLQKLPFDILGIETHSTKLDKQLKRHFGKYSLDNYDDYMKDNETCLVHYLITMYHPDSKEAWREVLDDHDLWVMLHDLTAAASETTATTIKWILLYLTKYPHLQTQAREELDGVIGPDDNPSVHHRKELPFLEAVILEGLRLGNVVPLGLPHSTTQDVVYRGYIIPKNTTMLLNIGSVMNDPAVFPNPTRFDPSRFLSDMGKSVTIPEQFMPFSKGPRSCLGESIARIELFLYMATLLHKFEFHCPDHETLVDIVGEFGLTHAPKPFKVQIVPR